MRAVASVSFGKDSTAMLLMLIEKGWSLDEVVFYDTGVEFDEIYRMRDKAVREVIEPAGIKFIELKPKRPFMETAMEYEYITRKGERRHGYGWCGGLCRWGTKEKTAALDKYTKGADTHYIGIAIDETKRLMRLVPPKVSPLAQWNMTEADCLTYCIKRGFGFGGLYNYLDRVSCWCCRNKNLKELKAYRDFLPEYFDRLVEMERRIGEPMKKPYYLSERFGLSMKCTQLNLFGD